MIHKENEPLRAVCPDVAAACLVLDFSGSAVLEATGLARKPLVFMPVFVPVPVRMAVPGPVCFG